MNKIDELICTYQGRIETETKLLNIEFKAIQQQMKELRWI